MKMYRNQFGIYKIELNNKIYVGSTIRPFKIRWKDHLNVLQQEKHHSQYLQNAYNRYGDSTLKFSILEIVKNKEDCIFREQYYIDTLQPEYNICKIAGNCLGVKHTKETRKNMSEAHKNPSKEYRQKISERQIGRKLSEETKKRMSKAQKGRKHSEETRKKMSEAKKGKELSEEHKKKLSEGQKGRNAWNKGKKMTDIYRKKMSESHKGQIVSKETRQKMSERMKGNTYASTSK